MFLDAKKKPTDAALRDKLAASYRPFRAFVDALEAEMPRIAREWKFSKTSGWYLVFNAGRQRLFYLFPRDADFVFKAVFNDAALTSIRKSGYGAALSEMLDEAKKYPEGTLLQFDRRSFDPDLVLALMRIKRAR